jgi:hypothetical protein
LHFLFLYCFCKNLKLDQHNFDFFYWYRFYVMIVRFVDIGWIVDHHCLDFLFMISDTLYNYYPWLLIN